MKPNKNKKITIALAGNANVGKSVIFNYLTGLHQYIGNWPGKTVEKAEGTLHYKGYIVDILDLPGIYSLGTYSLEELVSREYIIEQKPDLVINVVDATVLERNLLFTLQLLDLGIPVIIALNFVNVAKEKSIVIDHQKLEEILGIPVIPIVAITGKGIFETLKKGFDIIKRKEKIKPKALKYSQPIENAIENLLPDIRKIGISYPPRFTAIKLLEKDAEIEKLIKKINPAIVNKSKDLRQDIKRYIKKQAESE